MSRRVGEERPHEPITVLGQLSEAVGSVEWALSDGDLVRWGGHGWRRGNRVHLTIMFLDVTENTVTVIAWMERGLKNSEDATQEGRVKDGVWFRARTKRIVWQKLKDTIIADCRKDDIWKILILDPFTTQTGVVMLQNVRPNGGGNKQL
ncbi:unnamed protein product [Arctogadus glacialis]